MARINIFVYRNDAGATFFQDWDYMEKHPLGGTEASALRMGAALRGMGHEVHVTNNVRDLHGGCDVFVSTRGWEIFERGIRPGRLNYLWCTDDADQPFHAKLAKPEIAARVYGTVDGVMMLSRYHQRRWQELLHLPDEKVFLTSNG